MQFRRVIDNPEGICILHNDPGIAQNLEITEQKSELTITNLIRQLLYGVFCQLWLNAIRSCISITMVPQYFLQILPRGVKTWKGHTL